MEDEIPNVPGSSIPAVVHKYKLGEEPSDLAYWLSRTPEERIAVVEMMRREVHGDDYETEQGFQRVYKIIELK